MGHRGESEQTKLGDGKAVRAENEIPGQVLTLPNH